MIGANEVVKPWKETLQAWLHPRVLTMLFLGFSAGIPILLIFSTLSAWLREAGIERGAVTFFSWAALGYSFKFVWAPLIDKMPLPILTRYLGRRRSWMIVSQTAIIGAILWMASIDPSLSQQHLTAMAFAAILLGFSSATQDIVIDAFRIECVEEKMQAMLSATYIAGYRIGMLVAGAGSLALAGYLGTTMESYDYRAWQFTYFGVGGCMLIGILTTLITSEPERNATPSRTVYSTMEYLRFFMLFLCVVSVFATVFFYTGSITAMVKGMFLELSPLFAHSISFLLESGRLFVALLSALLAARGLVLLKLVDRRMVDDTYVDPVKDFFRRYGLKTAILLLLLVGFYRVSDIVLGVISTVFYLDLGFTKMEIATIVKTFGLLMTIVGGFLGGLLTVRFGVLRILLAGAVLSAGTNVLFMLLAGSGPDPFLLKVVIGADNLAAGLASAAFVAFLSGLTSISFTAVQYAVFSSIMSLFPKLIGGYSGTIVTGIGYQSFFLI
ncbi:MAG: MFS transporter, partial [Desulfocapsaceae bacterium]|nr:MFS transporter [Desulfocapsaceae bacterium]